MRICLCNNLGKEGCLQIDNWEKEGSYRRLGEKHSNCSVHQGECLQRFLSKQNPRCLSGVLFAIIHPCSPCLCSLLPTCQNVYQGGQTQVFKTKVTCPAPKMNKGKFWKKWEKNLSLLLKCQNHQAVTLSEKIALQVRDRSQSESWQYYYYELCSVLIRSTASSCLMSLHNILLSCPCQSIPMGYYQVLQSSSSYNSQVGKEIRMIWPGVLSYR